MKWVNASYKLPIKSWCEKLEDGALEQAKNLANHRGMVFWANGNEYEVHPDFIEQDNFKT